MIKPDDSITRFTESKLLCKDCKHSFVPGYYKFLNIIFKLGFASEPQYHCRKTYQEKRTEYNPVTGTTYVGARYESCSLTRSFYRHRTDPVADCGPKGQLWQPKYKKDLFLSITRGKV